MIDQYSAVTDEEVKKQRRAWVHAIFLTQPAGALFELSELFHAAFVVLRAAFPDESDGSICRMSVTLVWDQLCLDKNGWKK